MELSGSTCQKISERDKLEKELGERRRQRLHQRSRSLAASEAAPLLHLQPPPPPSIAVPSVAAAAPSLLSVPPPMAASSPLGRVSPTPYFHHGHGNGVNPTLLSGDVKASAALVLLVLPSSVFSFFDSLFPHLSLFGYCHSSSFMLLFPFSYILLIISKYQTEASPIS